MGTRKARKPRAAGALAAVALATLIQMPWPQTTAAAPCGGAGRWGLARVSSAKRPAERWRRRLGEHGVGEGKHGSGKGGKDSRVEHDPGHDWRRGSCRAGAGHGGDRPEWHSAAGGGGGSERHGSSTPVPSSAEEETAEATRDAAIISALAFVAALIGIFENWRRARQRRTYEWVERIGDLQLVEHQAVMASFLRGGMRPPGVSDMEWAKMKAQADIKGREATWRHLGSSSSVEDRRTVVQILAFPNTLEALAGMYNQRLLNRGVVKVHVEGQARSFWDRADWWVLQLRTEAGSDYPLKDLDKMLKNLQKRKRPWRAR
jgi:hypothetical protein